VRVCCNGGRTLRRRTIRPDIAQVFNTRSRGNDPDRFAHEAPSAGFARNPRDQKSAVSGQKATRFAHHRAKHASNFSTQSCQLGVFLVGDI
jgi:hypothetical protein